MKICDLTQFYSPVSGGVRRYVSEKIRHIQERTPADEHILIVPGERDGVTVGDRCRTYTIRSPLISRTSRYRIVLRLDAIETILAQERPDLVESGDPYQVAWKAVRSGAALNIPVIGFYHSHFPEAYVRVAERFLGKTVTDGFLDLSRRYVRNLYNRFERTLVPSPDLGALLTEWGVRNVTHTNLGVDTEIFRPQPASSAAVRAKHGIPAETTLLLYVGRLAQEKNTHTLFEAFRLLHEREPGRYHLMIVGDGLQRMELNTLRESLAPSASLATPRSPAHVPLTWIPYCTDAQELAAIYRAANVFLHPGIQETFGLVTLEAQACGVPVLGIRGTYMDRIIHSDQSLWATENSPAALATAVQRTACVHAASRPDPGSLHQCVAAQYSWEQIFTQLFASYRQVVANFARSQ